MNEIRSIMVHYSDFYINDTRDYNITVAFTSIIQEIIIILIHRVFYRFL